jgi:hypothetical protein
MKIVLFMAGAAAVGLTAGASQAATHHRTLHHGGMASAGAYAQPQQPVAYSQLSAYLKASPHQRAGRDWGGQMAAATGSNVNANAAVPAAPAADAQPDAASAATPNPAAMPVNPPADGNAAPTPAPRTQPAPASPEPPAADAPAAQPAQPAQPPQ